MFNAIAKATKPKNTPDQSADYRILIHDVDVVTTLDKISITTHLYCPAKPNYSGQKNITVQHCDFEDWADANSLLELDDTFGTTNEDGEYVEHGSRYDISYTSFVMEHATKSDFITYLLQMTELQYDFDLAFLKSQNVQLV